MLKSGLKEVSVYGLNCWVPRTDGLLGTSISRPILERSMPSAILFLLYLRVGPIGSLSFLEISFLCVCWIGGSAAAWACEKLTICLLPLSDLFGVAVVVLRPPAGLIRVGLSVFRVNTLQLLFRVVKFAS